MSNGSIFSSFQKWFLDTTNAMYKVTALAVVLSAFAAACLFSLPIIKGDTTPIKLNPSSRNKPNIFLIIVDSLTAEDMSLYGYSLPTTPNLERITQTWTVYTNAISPITCSIGYLPSILTGRYHYLNSYPNYQVGDWVYRFPDWVDISLLLKKGGYDIWRVGYLTPGFMHLGFGIDHFGAPDNNTYMHKYWMQPEGKVIQSPYFPYTPLFLNRFFPAGLTKGDVTLELLPDILKSYPNEKPLFLYYHYDGAHGTKYYSPDTLGTFLPIDQGFVQRPEKRKYFGKYDIKEQDMVDKLRLRYDEAVLQQDIYLDKLINQLKEMNLYESSMIVITADHGQNFSNGYTSHCTPLLSYPEIHVPLLIKYPYQAVGERINSVVSAIDLTPTILEVAGIKYSPKWFDGISLFKTRKNPHDRIVLTKYGSTYSVAATNNDWKLTYRRNEVFLFDIHNDPQEKINLYEKYRDTPEIIVLKKTLDQFINRIKLLNAGDPP